MKTRLRGRAALAVLLLGIAGGCGGEAPDFPRERIEGTVNLDGQPLENGLITLTPINQPEPIASAVIAEGAFTIDQVEGPSPGPHKVEIWSRRPSGKKVRDPDNPGHTIDEIRSVIPDRYNTRSDLTAEVRSGAGNRLDFDLKSAPSRSGVASRSRSLGR